METMMRRMKKRERKADQEMDEFKEKIVQLNRKMDTIHDMVAAIIASHPPINFGSFF